jgi:hypothetical protein
MKTTLLLAALALGTTSAYACDWQKQANSTPVTVAEQTTTKSAIQQEPAAVSSEAPAPSVAESQKTVQAAQN